MEGLQAVTVSMTTSWAPGTELFRSHNILLNPNEDANGCNETWCVCVYVRRGREKYQLSTRRNPFNEINDSGQTTWTWGRAVTAAVVVGKKYSKYYIAV